ncbi:hypothetical protein [Enterovibrio coralii]|uniref:hypothetical protein n=1 Tax=Enterovibrio coralii TaxID=294935 RepID=UPI000A45CF8B|nr:hypothetical protein [Enterovibrio coralii]
MAHLFPESEESTQIQSTLGQWKNGVEATFTQMQERFETARTRAANVSLLMENGRVDQVKTLAKGLENYAISLSPMVARVSFAEQLIEEGDTERAMAELTIIDNQLKALAMKKVLLMEKVQNSEDKVPVN